MEQVGLAAATTDVSLWSLFMQAGLVVKLVMLGLIAASVWTWAIVIDKYAELTARARRQFDKFEQVFWSGQSLEELYRTLSERQTSGIARDFRRRHARVEEELRARRAFADRPADAYRPRHGRDARA